MPHPDRDSCFCSYIRLDGLSGDAADSTAPVTEDAWRSLWELELSEKEAAHKRREGSVFVIFLLNGKFGETL